MQMDNLRDYQSCTCAFCFKELNETENYESLFGVYGDMLNKLLIQLNLENLTTQPLACSNCIMKIKSAFSFKSTCIDTMTTLIPYTDSNGKVTTDLKLVYCKEKGGDTEMDDNTTVCRLCMKLFNVYYGIALDEILEELHFTNKMFKHIPEVVNQYVENSVICNSCLIDLQQFSDLIFMSSCQNSDIDYLSLPVIPLHNEKKIPEDTKEIEIVNSGVIKNEHPRLNECNNSEVTTEIPRTKIEINLSNHATTSLAENYIKIEEDSDCLMQEIKQEQLITCTGRVKSNGQSSSVNAAGSSEASTLKHEISDDDDDCIIVDTVTDEIIDVCDNEPIELKDMTEDERVKFEFVDEYECDICFFKESNPAKFYEHEEIHDKKKNLNRTFTCCICSMKTKGLVGREVHMLAWHKELLDKKKIKCKDCKFATHYVYLYQEHLKVHKYDKNYIKCQKCDYKTKYDDILRVHLDKVHADLHAKNVTYLNKNNFESIDYEEEAQPEFSTKRFYRCLCCKYKARKKRKFEIHMKTEHQIFKCTDCNYITMHRQYFQTHVDGHVRNIPLDVQCQLCSFESHNPQVLRSHINIHRESQRREYICKNCRFITISKAHFMEHMLCHRSSKE